MTQPKTPPKMGAAGRRLWRDIVGTYDLRPDELLLLEKASRTADDAERLDAAVAEAPLMILGSQGQPREHPLLAQSRQTRALLAALLKQLALPDDAAASGTTSTGRAPSTASQKAMTAARARWGSPGVHRGA